MIMGISTFFIGLIPSYDTIGNAAPLILIFLRLCQGFAIGGEWGGATTLITEYAPRHRRGFFGTFVQLGNVLGLFIATGVFALVVMLPEDDLMSWGWRVPFLLSIALLFVGMFIRSRIEETPVFQENQKQQQNAPKAAEQKFPILTVLKHHRKAVFLAMGMRMGEIVLGWLTVAFFMSYVTRELNFTRETALNGLLLVPALSAFLPFRSSAGFQIKLTADRSIWYRRRYHADLCLPAILDDRLRLGEDVYVRHHLLLFRGAGDDVQRSAGLLFGAF
ncbi:MFS transporter [Klebsiella michiganensis]|nr:MFS transporter [Klebsiella michiganensis]